MEINRNNFKESLPQIEAAIEASSFLAIDTEFTGLEVHGNSIHAFDMPEDRYQKLLKSAKSFIIVQFGLATFQYNETTKRYAVSTYNFYIFPRSHCKQAPDVRFLCQSSSLDFLVSQGMDITKIVKDGISYLLPSDKQRLLEILKQKHAHQNEVAASESTPPPSGAVNSPTLNREQQRFIDSSLRRVDEFLGTERDSKSADWLDIEPCNAFVRKCLFETITQKYKLNVRLESKVNDRKQRYIRVGLPHSQEDLQQMERERQNAELEELDDAVGFSKIIKMISESGKLVIGHNMLLDVLHVINQFCFELPAEYEEFKNITQCIFPRIIDTKHMASSSPIKDFVSNTTLADLQKELEKSPFAKVQVDVNEGFADYENNARLHEAGYDAYITGLCFVSMTNYIGSKSNPRCDRVLPDSPLLEPFKNKLHLMRIGDIPYINLDGSDLSPSRDHVFHLTFDKDKKAADILKLFSPFGSIQIVWLGDNSALVALYKKDQAEKASNVLTRSRNGWCRVLTYDEYVSTIKNTNTLKTSTKRRFPLSDPTTIPRKQSPSTVPVHSKTSDISTIPEEEGEEEGNSFEFPPVAASTESSTVLTDGRLDEEDLGEPVAKRPRKDPLPFGEDNDNDGW